MTRFQYEWYVQWLCVSLQMEHIPLSLLHCQVRMWNIQDEDHPLLFRIVPHPMLKGVVEDDHTPLGDLYDRKML